MSNLFVRRAKLTIFKWLRADLTNYPPLPPLAYHALYGSAGLDRHGGQDQK